jgi:hypothetical protein
VGLRNLRQSLQVRVRSGTWRPSLISFHCLFRGPLGAALLLYRTKGRSLAALGALVIVLLLAIDSFFQQVVDLPERWVVEASSSIPRVVNYKTEYLAQYFQGYELQQIDEFMAHYVKQYFYQNGTQPVPYGNGNRPDIPLNCPTSACTWPAYETLGICSECADASDLLQFKCMYTKLDWTTYHTGPVLPEATPNRTVCGYFYDAGKDGPFLMSGYIVNNASGINSAGEALLVRTFGFTDHLYYKPISGGSEKFKHIRNPLLDALIVSSPDANSVYQHKPPIAQECVVSWCIKTIQSSYEAGRYSEKVIDTYQNTTTGPFPWESYELPIIDNLTSSFVVYSQNVTIGRQALVYNSTGSNISSEIYTVNNVTTANHIVIFGDMFPSYFTDHGPSGKPTLRFKDFWPGASFRELAFNPWQAPNNVTRHLERMATSMTDAMRSTSSIDMVVGTASSKTAFISIRWAWLSFPLVLLVLSLIFLVAIIIKTSDSGTAGIWKTSAMPALIYGLPKETQNQFTSSSTWASGKGASRKTRIKILPDMGWRISGQSQLSHSPNLPQREHV